ncbi:MAG TPA: glycosyltransferase, partial [Alphaproteobacteria bacterium]|nr:glycosyltransferase [Alphaproteobacteria bacterium]
GGDDLELRHLAYELGLDEKANFLGERTDIDNLMEKSDLYALITNWEGLPLTIIEAMRAGLPVVATNVGGVGELISPNETGILVEPNSDEALIMALETLLKDRDALEKMGQAGRKRYENHFTFAAMAQRTVAVYERITSLPDTRNRR